MIVATVRYATTHWCLAYQRGECGSVYFRAFPHGSTPAKVVLLRRLHLSAVSSPVARRMNSALRAAAWLGVPPRANARAEPGNRTFPSGPETKLGRRQS